MVFMKLQRTRLITTIAIAAFILMTGRGSPATGTLIEGSNRPARQGDKVCVDYTGTFPGGQVFDTSVERVAREHGQHNPERTYEPLCFTVGAHQVVPGFENAVVGMKPGDTKSVTISPDQAYGERKPELVISVPMASFGEKPRVNEVYGFSDSRTGQVLPGRVDSVDEAAGIVNVDFNSEMAGKTLQFEITLQRIE